MPRVCVYPHCFNQQKPGACILFHKLPRDPHIRTLWLNAMGLNEESPSIASRDVVVCGEHFSVDNYRIPNNGQPQSKMLQPFAVPFTFIVPGRPVHENETAASEGGTDPTATPQKKSNQTSSFGESAIMKLVLTSPQQTERTKPSTSGTYYAFSPAWTPSAGILDPETVLGQIPDGDKNSAVPIPDDITLTEMCVSPRPPTPVKQRITPAHQRVPLETYYTFPQTWTMGNPIADEASCTNVPILYEDITLTECTSPHHSTPVKQRLSQASPFESSARKRRLSQASPFESSARKKLFLESPSPQQVERPIRTQPSSSLHDTSMESLEVPPSPADTSYVPLSGTSSSEGPMSVCDSESEHTQHRWDENKWVVNESCLMELFKTCHFCGVEMDTTKVIPCGSRISVQCKCLNGHSRNWSSCPDKRGMPENNLLISASTLFTGASYSAISEWASVLKLQIPKKTTFYSIQSSYLIPVIDKVYQEQHQNILDRVKKDKRIHLCGDGRCDSPGFSAKYGTYSFMDDVSKEIITFELLHVSQAKSSGDMEPKGFQRGLDYLIEENVDVEVVTTDRSPSIRKIMPLSYPNIQHEFDIWHVSKGLTKKLTALSNRKANRPLQPWIKSISNHLWYCCATCEGDPEKLTRNWTALLHHICGEHRWEEDGQERKCQHEDLTPEQQRRKRWLNKDSPAFKSLSSVVLGRNLLKDLKQMSLFKHTGALEIFHSKILKYSPKRLHFSYQGMKARMQLAVLDHNENTHTRKQATTATGKPRTNITFSRRQKHWVRKPIYQRTTQRFRTCLIEQLMERRQDTSVKFKDHDSRVQAPPLPPNIALIPKPDADSFEQVSRFEL